MVWQLNEKINSQDSLIILYITKETNYTTQINTYEQASNKQDELIKLLEKDVTTLTRKNNRLRSTLKWLGGGFVASLLTITTFIVIK